MMRKLSEFILLKIWGFEIIGHYPSEIKKMIIAIGPHTTMWEWFIGIFFRNIYDVDISYFIKKEMTTGILGKFLLWMGGIPVDRSKSTNFTKSVAETIREKDHLIIAVTPEGTRKKVDRLKTGYYYIAKEAEIPILPIRIHYRDKKLELDPLIYPGEDTEADLLKIENIFKGTIGKYPEKSYL